MSIPLLRRSTTKLKKKRSVVIFNCGTRKLDVVDSDIVIVDLEDINSNDSEHAKILKIGRAYVCILISDFVLFDSDDNTNDHFKGLLLGFCDNQNKLFGTRDGSKEDTVNYNLGNNTNTENLFDVSFKSNESALKWIKDYLVPKKLKLNAGGSLYWKSIKGYMTKWLDKDDAMKKLYFAYPHVRKMLDKVPRVH